MHIFYVQAISATEIAVSLDVKLIPEFDGSCDVLDWLEKVELVCGLQEPPVSQTLAIPLRLKGGASAVYWQLAEADRKNINKINDALKRALAMDKNAAYEQFSARRLRRSGETADVFLAELQHLATLFGGMSDEAPGCAFVAGLPDSTRQISSRSAWSLQTSQTWWTGIAPSCGMKVAHRRWQPRFPKVHQLARIAVRPSAVAARESVDLALRAGAGGTSPPIARCATAPV